MMKPMSDSSAERTVGTLRIRIDRLLCVGFGDCIDAAPDVFELAEDGIVTFTTRGDDADRGRLIRACDVCPVDALSVFDEDGTQLV